MKRIISILLIVMLVLGLFVGCAKKEPEKTSTEIIEIAEEKIKEVGNTGFNAEMTIDLGVVDPSLGLTGPIGVTFDGEIFSENNMHLNINLDTGQGMVISGEIFIKDDEVLIHAPMLAAFLGAEYIKMDMTTLTEASGVNTSDENRDRILEVFRSFRQEKNYTNVELLVINELVEEVEITVNETLIDSKKVTATVDLEKIVELGLAFLDYISENKEAQDVFFENLTQEEIDEALAQIASDEIRVSLDEMLEKLTINAFDFILYVDVENLPVKMEYNVDVDVTEEEVATNVKSNGFVSLFNIGSIEEILLPEVDEDKVLDFNDFY